MNMEERIKDFGEFNGWKGFIGLYFTKKELRVIAKEVGIKAKEIGNYKLVEIYNLYK